MKLLREYVQIRLDLSRRNATPENLADVLSRSNVLQEALWQQAKAVAAKINKLRLNLKLDTGETGKAFGSITAADLLERLKQEIKDLVLPTHAIVLDRPLKESGEHQIPVKIHSEVIATLRVEIAAAPKVEQPVDEEEAGTRRPRRKSAASSENAEA